MQKKRGQFSIEIVRCDGFVSMPATAQALYLQILASCDDEGFTSQLEMCKFMAKASDKDVQLLIDREFILRIKKEGRTISVVKHWWLNNYIREDRIEPSSFSERSLVYVKPNGNYTLEASEGSPLPQPKKSSQPAKGRPYVSQVSAKSQQTRTAPCVAPRAAEQDNTTQDNTDTPNVVSNNTTQDTTIHSIPNQEIEPDRTRYKQHALLKLLLDSGYIDEDEIMEDGWDDLLDSYSKIYGWLDVKIKLKYFISKVCQIELKEDEYGNITFSRKWDGKSLIENRFLYFKSSMDSSFKKFAVGQDPADDDPF